MSQTQQPPTEPSVASPEPSTTATALVANRDPTPTPAAVEEPIAQLPLGTSTSQLSLVRHTSPRRAGEDLAFGRSPKRQRIEATTEDQGTRATIEPSTGSPAPTQQEGQAPAATRFVSSFVNKNPGAKKVAPKAARRRHQAAAPQTTAPQAAAPQVAVLQTEVPQPAIAQKEPAIARPTPTQTTDDTTQTTTIRTTEDIPPITDPTPTPSEIIAAVGTPDDVNGESGTSNASAEHPTPRNLRKRLPWAAVNQPRDDEEEVTETDAITQPSASSRGRRKATTTPANVTAEEEQEEAEVSVVPTPESARRTGKQKATDETSKEWTPTAPPPRPRKERKDKGKKRKGGTTEDGPPRVKRSYVRKKKPAAAEGADATPAEEEGREGSQDQPVRPRGRQREETPSDAEDHLIDATDTFMNNLASRNIRTGKLSEREKKMRQIDWVAVKQRRRDEEALAVAQPRKRNAQVEEALDQAGQARDEAVNAQEQSGPRMEVVNGVITMVQSSVNIDREADADREIELMEEVAEDDLTTRITSKSFMRSNKRFPQDLLLPGQGRRWTTEATEQFYEALQMFGTDFMMIATMFPGTTRRSIKMKFNREERENPARINAALHMPKAERGDNNWAAYLDRVGMKDEDFEDPQAHEERLKAERADKEIEIAVARAKREEENRQKRLAGLPVTDDEDDNADPAAAKERAKERKKADKRREKQAKQVTFANEKGVEVLGAADEEGWDD